MKEEWKDIEGFEYTKYQVSNFGRIRSIRFIKKTQKFKTYLLKLSPISPKHPNLLYYRVCLYQNPKERRGTRRRVHQLVAEAFIPKPPKEGLIINHKDGNKHNNRVDNLEWVTASENCAHAYQTGLNCATAFKKGERHPNSKLKIDEVKRIKKLISNGISCRAIARHFKVSHWSISDIATGRNWNWL